VGQERATVLARTWTDPLKWDDHVRTICNKAASRINFLKQLKRSSVEPEDIFMLLWSDQSSNMHVQFGIAV